MATEVGFYHCSRAPADEIAVRLVAKVHASGQRLLVVAAADRLAALDRALWADRADSFLPHGIAGTPHDARQPILLAEQPLPANGARVLLLLGEGLPAEVDGFDRLLCLFDDGMPCHQRARHDWRAIGSRAGLVRSYWQQTTKGAWEKKA